MHKARAFFFVCAGLLCLALAYHLGATSARGQVSGTGWFVAGTDMGTPYVVTASGDWWRHVGSYGWLCDQGNMFGGTSSGRTIVSLGPGIALTSTGEVWYGGYGGTWVSAGTPPLGQTATQDISIGQLKAKYAPASPGK